MEELSFILHLFLVLQELRKADTLAEEVGWLGSAPNGGWFGYQPNAGMKYSPGTAMDYWAIGLQILGIASLISAFNFITTIINMRTQGMRLMRMPVFTWMTFAVALSCLLFLYQ